VELEKAEARAASLRADLDDVSAVARRLRERLDLLDELTTGSEDETLMGSRPKPRLVPSTAQPPRGWLKGARIRRVAVRILAASDHRDTAIHYTAWLRLVEGAGYGVSGRDPSATFLTQIGRSPVVSRGDQPGTYVLDTSSIRTLRERLAMLNEELLGLHRGQQTIEGIATARERRAELIAEIGATERALEEALEAVGTDEGG
jgi:hypothetical protein